MDGQMFKNFNEIFARLTAIENKLNGEVNLMSSSVVADNIIYETEDGFEYTNNSNPTLIEGGGTNSVL